MSALDELVTAILATVEAPPPPERIEVARDLYDRMRRDAEPIIGFRPTISSAFGIPVVIDDELADGEWRIIARSRRSS